MADNLFPEDVLDDEEYNEDEENEGTEEESEDNEEGAGYVESIFFDFASGDFVRSHDGSFQVATGFEAWAQWCQKTLMTQRYTHEAYSTDFGVDYEGAFESDNIAETKSILVREIEEALLADPSGRTMAVGNIEFETEADNCCITVNVQGIDGDIDIAVNVKGIDGNAVITSELRKEVA